MGSSECDGMISAGPSGRGRNNAIVTSAEISSEGSEELDDPADRTSGGGGGCDEME